MTADLPSLPTESRDLEGRTFLVTGATSGIGRATTLGLAARGARLVLACRSPDRARALVEQVEDGARRRGGRGAPRPRRPRLGPGLRRRGRRPGRPGARAGQQRGRGGRAGRHHPGLRADLRGQPPGPLPADHPAARRPRGPGARPGGDPGQQGPLRGQGARLGRPATAHPHPHRPARVPGGEAVQRPVHPGAGPAGPRGGGAAPGGDRLGHLAPGALAAPPPGQAADGHVRRTAPAPPCAGPPPRPGAPSGSYVDVDQVAEPNPLATPELAAELWRRSEAWTG